MINTIIQGDCLEVMKDIPDNSIDMVLCDLPYNITKFNWDTPIDLSILWQHYDRIIKDGGPIILTASQPFTTGLIQSGIKLFKYELIWSKPQGGMPGIAKYRPMPSHESILVFGKGRLTYNPQMSEGDEWHRIERVKGKQVKEWNLYGKNKDVIKSGKGRYPKSVIQLKYSRAECKYHPTQKPLILFKYLILTYTNPGNTVLDNAIGSGTTAIAALETNRQYIGIELDPIIYKTTLKRIDDYMNL